MLRTFFNQQLGFFTNVDSDYSHCDDKAIKINFYTQKLNEARAKLNIDDADYLQNLSNIEISIEALHELGINIKDEAQDLIREYQKIMTSDMPRFDTNALRIPQKMLHIKFHFLNAASNANDAIEVLGWQDITQECYFTEQQMLDLDSAVEKAAKNSELTDNTRLDAIKYCTNYYLRLANINPEMLANYAEYLCRCALTESGRSICSKLNAFVRDMSLRRYSSLYVKELFDGYTITENNHSLFITREAITLPLNNFIRIIKANVTVFAYWDLDIERRRYDTNISTTHRVLSRLNQLTVCVESLINNSRPISAATFDVLNTIVKYEHGHLKNLAENALRVCEKEKVQPFVIAAPIPSPAKMRC